MATSEPRPALRRARRRPHRPRPGITLMEMLVAVAASSVLVVGMGSLFMQAIWSYRNVNYLTTGYIGQSRVDSVMRSLLMVTPPYATNRKAFNTTPSVNGAGTPVAPVAFAYVVVNDDKDDGDFPPLIISTGPAAQNPQTGVIYWYRNNPLAGQGAVLGTEATQYQESTLLWFEVQQSQATTVLTPPGTHNSFVDFSDSELLTFTNTLSFRKASAILSTNVASFVVDSTNFPNISYRVEFQTPPL